MKQTTEKTHRILHKHIRVYEAVLYEPAKKCFLTGNSLMSIRTKGTISYGVEQFLVLTVGRLLDTLFTD